MKPIGRKEFIKYSSGLIAFALVGKYVRFPRLHRQATEEVGEAPVKPKARAFDGAGTEANPGNHFALVIDVGACIGCRRCQWACKKENNIPDTIAPPWIEVFELSSEESVTGHPSPQDLKTGATTSYTEAPMEGKWYLPVQCNHCDNPPCVKVCPVQANYKDKDGLVLTNYDRCIGCRICVVACPYSARRFNWLEPKVPAEEVNPLVPVRPISVVEKCTFCVHRVRRGELPRCVGVCPVRARHFGNLNDPESEVAKILKTNLSFRLLEEANTKPNIWYITRGKKWVKP